MSRVLIVSYLFPPFNGPGTQHATWFHRYLREYGFDTVALTSARYFEQPRAEGASAPDIWRLPDSPRARRLASHLYHAEMSIQQRLGLWDPGFVWSAVYAVPAASRGIRLQNFDAILSVSPTVASHWTALRLKRRFPKLRWIADFQDPFVGNPFGRTRLATPLKTTLERAIFSGADVLSANTDTVQEMWCQRYPQYRDKIMVTWGGFDPEEAVGPLPLESATPVLRYVGALYGNRTAAVLLRSLARLIACGRLRKGDLAVEFLGAGEFGPLEPIVADLQQQGFLKVRRDYVPRAEALEFAARGHCSLLLDITGDRNTALQVPAKLFDQIRIGRPILAFTIPGSPTDRILAGSGIAHVRLAPDAADEEVDAGVLQLMTLSPEARCPSDWFRNTFDARHLTGLLAARLRGENS
jgi:hypothetical protein